jgi:transposase
LAIVADNEDRRIPIDARASLMLLGAQLQALQTLIGMIEKRIIAQRRSNEANKRLETIPGIGVIGATAIAATVADPTVFRSGRDFAAWIGLVPRQDSTGGKQKLGPISKQGDRRLKPAVVLAIFQAIDRGLCDQPMAHGIAPRLPVAILGFWPGAAERIAPIGLDLSK